MSSHVFTSDLHFGHVKVAGLRGFSCVEDHDEAVLEALRTGSRYGDVVWILGDLVGQARHLSDALGALRYALPGRRLRLVLGNHDPAHPMNRNAHRQTAALAEVFEWWGPFARTRIGGRDVVLSHFPYTRDRGEPRFLQWRVRNEGAWLLHGHTHGEERVTQALEPYADEYADVHVRQVREVHVGWDAWGRPVPDHEVAALITDAEGGTA